MTKNVCYSERPERVIVNRINHGYTARVDMPVNIREITDDEGNVSYMADVYSLEAGYTPHLMERVEADYEGWMAIATEIPAPQPTLQDVIEAVNILTEMVVLNGGE